MLRRLLQLAARARTVRSTELARALGVSPALVESMLEALAQRGYLRLLAPGCAVPCERCPARAACLPSNGARVWVLVARGQGSAGTRPRHAPRTDDAERTGP